MRRRHAGGSLLNGRIRNAVLAAALTCGAVAGCANSAESDALASRVPTDWATYRQAGVHWQMPRSAQVNATDAGWNYGRSAVKADGSLDPCGSFNVFITKPLDNPPKSNADVEAVFSQRITGIGGSVLQAYPVPAGKIGYEADAVIPVPSGSAQGCDGKAHFRVTVFGNVVATAAYAGNVGVAGPYFLDSFGSD
jgi:outer membrane murein-binding lipoprotein Lpp